MSVLVETFPVGPLQCNCSILVDEATREAVVVDPGDEPERILDALSAAGVRPVALLHTHAHFDHITGTELVAESTGAPIRLHPADQPPSTKPCRSRPPSLVSPPGSRAPSRLPSPTERSSDSASLPCARFTRPGTRPARPASSSREASLCSSPGTRSSGARSGEPISGAATPTRSSPPFARSSSPCRATPAWSAGMARTRRSSRRGV